MKLLRYGELGREHPALLDSNGVLRDLSVRILAALGSLALTHLSLAAGVSLQKTQAPHSAPSIVVILLDDIGFADTSTFGGVARTPSLDRLAEQGLRYNNFNTVGICSSTRAALLTGRNHHRVGFGALSDTPGTAAGYDSVWNKHTASIAKILHQNGYSTAAIGKWHNTAWKEINPIGPFDRWPTGLGFDYFYGFMEPGAQSEWEPSSLYRNTTSVEPRGTPRQGYHLTTDLTDEAIQWVAMHETLAPEKPYFLYFATGAVHFPHHVAKEWIEKYRGQFDQGWDRLREENFARQKHLGVIPPQAQLTPRPKEIPAWVSLSADQKALYSRQMEVYAGFIEQTDHEVGRLLRSVQEGPQGDNTLIFYIVGDNGGSPGSGEDFLSLPEQLQHRGGLGGPQYLNGIEPGWGWASSTPFQWYKGIASHFGATRDPLVVSWPARINGDKRPRTQFTHVNDIAATIYEVTGISFPTTVDGNPQAPLDGVSFANTFDRADAPSAHHVQYFEMYGNRAIYDDGWVAAARHGAGLSAPKQDFDHDRWELYHVAEDYSESRDLAQQFPDRLITLQALFDSEARNNQVYPLGGAGPVYSSPMTKGTFTYKQGLPRILALAAPAFTHSHRINAQIAVPDSGAAGVIVSYGSRWGGFALYAAGDRIIYESNVMGEHRDVLTSNIPLPHGKVDVAFEFNADRRSADTSRFQATTGTGRLYINRQPAGQMKVQLDGGWGAYWGSFSIGQAHGSPVSQSFEPPFEFTGTLQEVRVELP